jgi:class 3 adenylate cyclase
MLDKRGTGLSDRVREVPTLETRMDDLRAVMDDVGAEDAVVWTAQEGARLASLLAATYPERTRGLVLFDPSAKGRRTADYPWALDEAEWRTRLREIREGWGRTEFLDARLAEWAPERCDDPDFRLWFLAHMRRGLSPGSALAFFRMTMESDVTDVLPVVRVPTVVLSSATNRGPARYFAERIPGARLVDLPVRSIYHWVDDESHTIAIRETKRLVEETQSEVVADRILATMLFTDIVGSTSRAAALGDLRRFRGEEQDTAGDGFFATFDGPARAIRCATAIVQAVRELGIDVRAGVHTGECEVLDAKVGGIAVHIAARVAAEASTGEVLVSHTVKDLVAGSGIEFDDRGAAELKGVPGEWRLYAAR